MKKLITKIVSILAKIIIRKYKPFIIGITGSVGKTSTKEAIALVLKKDFFLHFSPKNYNNDLGLPLTIIGSWAQGKNIFGWLFVFLKAILKIILPFKFPRTLVLEMAADRPGDIKYLTKLAPCQIGVLTAIAPVHLEKFKNIENIIKEKQIIVTHLLPTGWAVLNGDQENILELRNKISAKIITFGFKEGNDVKALEPFFVQEVNKDGDLKINGLRFKLSCRGNIIPVFLSKIIARHQIYSVLAAISVALSMELNLLETIDSLKTFEPPAGRMRIIKGIRESLIIDDSYNSSPEAVVLALETLAEIYNLFGRKKIIVLGDMLELGLSAEGAHYQIGQKIAEEKLHSLIVVGQLAKKIAEGAIKNGFAEEEVFKFENAISAGKFLKEKINYGDIILVKGSQGSRMEKTIKEIMAEPDRAKELLVRQGKEWE